MHVKYIDTHAHAYYEYYKDEVEAVIQRSADAGVAIINIGTNPETTRMCIDVAEQYAEIHRHIYSIPGIHPSFVSEQFDVAAFIAKGQQGDEKNKIIETIQHELLELDILVGKHLLSKNGKAKVVGIGECGIDLFRAEESQKPLLFELQRELFRGQIEIALKYDIPIMIHARESYSEILGILDENFSGDKAKLRGNIHFFAGSSEDAQMFLDRGFTVSFTGVITFASSYDEVLKSIPVDSFLSETDCPYVAPVPFRGKTNEPAYVIKIVEKMAEIRGMELEVCRKQLLANAERVFGVHLA